MAFKIVFSEQKNQLLKTTRGISFDEIATKLEKQEILDNIAHKSLRYAHQKMFIIEIHSYIYAVPYVMNKEKLEVFLKTIYPRLFVKSYRNRG